MTHQDATQDATQERADAISGPQRRALTALLEGATGGEAAKRAGVNRATVWRWLQDPAFMAALRQAEGEALSRVARSLAAKGASAVDVLATIMADATIPAAVRVRAASHLLARLVPVHDLAVVEARLDALEAAVDRGGDGR